MQPQVAFVPYGTSLPLRARYIFLDGRIIKLRCLQIKLVDSRFVKCPLTCC